MTSALSRKFVITMWISCASVTVVHAQLEEKKEDPFSQKEQNP